MPPNRPIHEVVDHEDLPSLLGKLGIHFEEDLREAMRFDSLRGKIAESDLGILREIINPR